MKNMLIGIMMIGLAGCAANRPSLEPTSEPAIQYACTTYNEVFESIPKNITTDEDVYKRYLINNKDKLNPFLKANLFFVTQGMGLSKPTLKPTISQVMLGVFQFNKLCTNYPKVNYNVYRFHGKDGKKGYTVIVELDKYDYEKIFEDFKELPTKNDPRMQLVAFLVGQVLKVD
ncbi:MAG: hypothetical protein H6922_01130 [Pseudomonadaceae bacterium]|nr:hypothetical protein [Pseudomonadaceae bacterium]